jgi:transcriptional regulator with XRE-family HTH domain
MLRIHYRPQTLIKEWRLEKGWTQEKVAKRIGVSRSHYSNFENGHRLLPDAMMGRIAKVLKVRA